MSGPDGRGRALDGLSWVPQQPWQSAWWRGAHLPTVVHSHEVTDQQEGVGQHAHCNLKPRETCVSVTPRQPHPGSWAQGAGAHCANILHHGRPPATTRAALPSPSQARGAVGRVADLTYPHHKLGVAADGQGLAELRRQKGRPVCHRHLRMHTPHTQIPATLPGPGLSPRPTLASHTPVYIAFLSGPASSFMALEQSQEKIWEAGWDSQVKGFPWPHWGQ